MIWSLRGRPWTPELTVCSVNAGIAATTRIVAAETAEIHGRRRTRRMTAVHAPPRSRRRCRTRATSGTRPRLTLSPSFESRAGRTVTEPVRATATTRIVPVANDWNVGLPVRYIPAMAIITVKPEISTARPEVAAATSSAASGSRPASRSRGCRARPAPVAFAADVEERVVAPHREPDQEDHRGDRLVDREELGDRPHDPERHRHRAQAEEHGDARRDERAEGDDENRECDGEGQRLRLAEVVLERLR